MRWLKENAPGVHRFLTRTDRPFPVVREILGVGLGLLLLLGLLFAATGQPLRGGYPVVVVTSGSMMHCENSNGYGDPSLGRHCDPARVGGLGFIDPGDLVFVRDIDERDDITTMAEGDRSRYGASGDVVVYRISGQPGVPIIHRALFWLEVEADGTFSVPELGLTGLRKLDHPAIQDLTKCELPTTVPGHAVQLRPVDSGFITKGDNNVKADQCTGGLAGAGPVRAEWILGKARGELPWVGLIKLFVDDVTSGSSNFTNANGGAKGFLAVTVLALVVGPWGVDRLRRRRKAPEDDEPEV